ncbi:MAG: hypothetical protein IJ445_02725 [Clostridia bacterium]|nr:hypothetical protein [Clostridia bacterium]
MKSKFKLCILYILSFLTSVAPLVIYVVINRARYISTVTETVKLSIGCMICAVLLLLKLLGKLKMSSSTMTFGVIFLLSYFLKSITDDLLVLSFLALAGDIADKIFFHIPIKRVRENIRIDKTADATAEKVGEMLEHYYRGGMNVEKN